MKKTLNVFIGTFTGILLTISAIATHEVRSTKVITSNSYALNSEAEARLKVQASMDAQRQNSSQEFTMAAGFSLEETTNDSEVFTIPTEPVPTPSGSAKTPAASKNVAMSRGGAPSMPSGSSVQAKPAETKKAKTELLDWRKEAQYVFARGDVATVKDVYTGKTFKVKRTMGTNHADAEALTSNDTKIIKSIWGGFSWDRRPVHIYIDGRVLAASMSAMPHAGIDSAPAYAYIKNRSGGYGSGENLDVVKNNDMDGHFDIHFLNSTRHKDGKVDAKHQAMIKIAATR